MKIIDKIRNLIFPIFLILGITLIYSCSDQNCKTTINYTNSESKTIRIGKYDSTFFGHIMRLSEINVKYQPVNDTLVKDSVLTSKEIKFDFIDKSFKSLGTFSLKTGEETVYGISEPGLKFSRIKVRCDSINIQDSTVIFEIWNSAYYQDCGNW